MHGGCIASRAAAPQTFRHVRTRNMRMTAGRVGPTGLAPRRLPLISVNTARSMTRAISFVALASSRLTTGGPTPNQENSQRIFRLVQIGLTQRRVGWIGEIGSERMAAASPTRRDLCLSTERYAKPRTRTAPSTAASTCRAAASAASCVL
jgi:hypothetical protein